MGKFRDRAKRLGRKVREGVNKGVDEYNQVIDKIKEPSVDVGLDQKTMLYIGGALLLLIFFWKRK